MRRDVHQHLHIITRSAPTNGHNTPTQARKLGATPPRFSHRGCARSHTGVPADTTALRAHATTTNHSHAQRGIMQAVMPPNVRAKLGTRLRVASPATHRHSLGKPPTHPHAPAPPHAIRMTHTHPQSHGPHTVRPAATAFPRGSLLGRARGLASLFGGTRFPLALSWAYASASQQGAHRRATPARSHRMRRWLLRGAPCPRCAGPL